MTFRALALATLCLSLIPVAEARAFDGPESLLLQEPALLGRFQGALGVLKGQEGREQEWKPVAAGPVMTAPAVSAPGAEGSPCRENSALDSTSFFLMLTPRDKSRPFTSVFKFESCADYDSDRDGRPGAGEPQAIRTYAGDKDYDLLLVTRQERGGESTELYLVRKLPDGGRQVSGSLGSVPTSELMTVPVRPSVPSVRVFSNGRAVEGTAELMPKRPE